MTELNIAYAFILNEVKQGYQQQKEEPKRQGAGEDAWHDVGEDRRTTRKRDTTGATSIATSTTSSKPCAAPPSNMTSSFARCAARPGSTGQRVEWAKLTWDDLFGFFRRTARSGVKGLALLFAALVGVGSVLVEANSSAVILLGSGIGFASRSRLRSDKGGMLSAALLLFGIMTIWLPPVRKRTLPLSPSDDMRADLARADFQIRASRRHRRPDDRRRARALCHRRDRRRHRAPNRQSSRLFPTAPPTPDRSRVPPTPADLHCDRSSHERRAVSPLTTRSPAPPEPRTLLAADGAILKFVSGVPTT